MEINGFPANAIPDTPSSFNGIMLIGEALGAEEANSGRVFVGASGRLLNEMLVTLGLATFHPCPCHNITTCYYSPCDRSNLYLTNVFMQRPPGNDVDYFFAKKKAAETTPIALKYPPFGKRGHLKKEFEFELDRLHSEIHAAKPKVVVVLGATALWAMTGHAAISNWRGILQMGTFYPVKTVATYHPAAVLRSYSDKPVVMADLQKAKENAGFPDIRRTVRTIWIAESLADIRLFRRLHFDKAIHFAYDIETDAKQISHLSIAPSPTASLVIPFFFGSHNYHTEEEEIAIWEEIYDMFQQDKIAIAQNSIYDLTYLREYGIFPKRIEDTMLLHHSLQPEMEKSLGFMASLYLNESNWKLMRVRAKDTINKADD